MNGDDECANGRKEKESDTGNILLSTLTECSFFFEWITLSFVIHVPGNAV